MIHDPLRLAADLRLLLREGTPLPEAVRYLHGAKQIGKLLLVQAVVDVTGMKRAEAQRLVVDETS